MVSTNKIDVFAKFVGIQDEEPRKIVKYTRNDVLTGKEIDYLDCFNDDSYVELFYEGFTVVLGGYMNIDGCQDPRVEEDAKELLDGASIRDFNESEFKKRLETFIG